MKKFSLILKIAAVTFFSSSAFGSTPAGMVSENSTFIYASGKKDSLQYAKGLKPATSK